MTITSKVVSFFLDELEYSTVAGNTVLQSSLGVGIDVPRFCYHEKLSIAGNCRMCLLEISYPRSLKPMASCALPIISGMLIYTNTIMVKKSREGVLELLLLNHPLDCPVCDQGGECDLQDETARFGGDRGRFYDSKRAVEDKELGPIIKTSMNRCIHCTKCVRFSNEICGESTLGVLGRGSVMEIGTYIDDSIESEFSGNLIDICPVGALTSKPYSFRARPWELRSFETVDVIDSIGSRLRVDIRGTEIMRVLPSQSEHINEDWITDRTRFSYDGLFIQRFYAPMLRFQSNLVPVTWELAFEISALFFYYFTNKPWHRIRMSKEIYLNLFIDRKNSVFGFFGEFADLETLLILSSFFRELGSVSLISSSSRRLKNNSALDFRSNYLLNIPFDFLEKIDFALFIGINIRLELPLLNLRIRKAFLHNNAVLISLGFLTTLTYQHFQQGTVINSLFHFLNGKSYASKSLIQSVFPVIFCNSSIVSISQSFNVFEVFRSLIKYSNFFTSNGWCALNLLNSSISNFIAKELALESQFLNPVGIKSSLFYFHGTDKSTFLKIIPNCFYFKIFHGHASNTLDTFSVDVILPGTTFVEKEATYLTLEGRIQKTKLILLGPSLTRTDWKIISGLRLYFYITQSYYIEFFIYLAESPAMYNGRLTTIENIRERLSEYTPSFDSPDVETPNISSSDTHVFFHFFSQMAHPTFFRFVFYMYNFFFVSNSTNFFSNNAITRNSKLMNLCANRFFNRQINFLK